MILTAATRIEEDWDCMLMMWVTIIVLFGRNSLVSKNSYVSKNSCGNKISCLAAIEAIAGMLGFLCGRRLEAGQVPARI